MTRRWANGAERKQRRAWDHSALVLDGQLRQGIDIVRSLGRRGCSVDILTSTRRPPAGYSRWVRDQFLLDFDGGPAEHGLLTVRGLLESRGHDVILAAGLPGNRFLAKHGNDLSSLVNVIAPTLEAFDVAEDKLATMKLAQDLGMAVPRTLAPESAIDLEQCRKWDYPLVVKSRGGQGRYSYAESFEHLLFVHAFVTTLDIRAGETRGLPLVQECVSGSGHGYFALCKDGEVLASFMHERLREVPPTGGPSSLARSFFDPDLAEAGRRLLQALKWSGVAMVEFKRESHTGRYVLLEINPKFWGSLGLAIAAGVDFPWLLAQLAFRGRVDSEGGYRQVVYQWLSMDIGHSIAVRRPFLWTGELAKGVPNDFRLQDPMPTLALIGQRAVDVARGRRRLHADAPRADTADGAQRGQ